MVIYVTSIRENEPVYYYVDLNPSRIAGGCTRSAKKQGRCKDGICEHRTRKRMAQGSQEGPLLGARNFAKGYLYTLERDSVDKRRRINVP